MKKILGVLILVIDILISIDGEAQDWSWARSSAALSPGKIQVGEGVDIVADASGNVYVAGFFGFDTTSLAFGPYTINNLGHSSLFLVKYDASGNVLWADSGGGPNCDIIVYGVALDIFGNILVTGSFTSALAIFSTDTLHNFGDISAFLVKYDDAGNLLWAKSSSVTGSTTTAIGSRIATDDLGNIFLTGMFYSGFLPGGTVSFDSFVLDTFGEVDIFFVKYDAMGSVEWAKSIGSKGDDHGTAVETDQENHIYLTGSFEPSAIYFGNDSLNYVGAPPSPNSFIAKFDESGSLLLNKNIGNVVTSGLAVDFSNNLSLTGYVFLDTTIIAGDTLVNTGLRDALIVKYDSSINPLWARSGGGTDYDVGYDIVTDALSNIYVTGWYNSTLFIIGSDSFPGNGSPHDPMFIAKYNTRGDLICASTLASGGEDGNAVATDSYSNVYIAGDFENANPFIVGSDTLIQTGEEDVFVAKWLCNIDGIPETNSSEQIAIYPNPVQTQLTIDLHRSFNEISIRAYDVSGRMITLPTTFTPLHAQLNTSSLPDGFYILQIIDKNTGKNQAEKFLKQE